jgi:hypothetical protein
VSDVGSDTRNEEALPWWADDDRLLASLDDALRSAQAVPRDLVEAAKAEYTWRSIDAELAALAYDSALEDSYATAAATRAEPAALRALTFVAPELTVELEVTPDTLLGQVVPVHQGEVEVRMASGQTVTAAIDEIGCFVVRPIPTEAFRLHCRTESGAAVLTAWVSL